VAVAIAKRSNILCSTGFGVENLGVSPPAPVTENTIFQVASITKQFTATLAMRIQEQRALFGLNFIDSPVANYLSGANWFDPVVSFNPAMKVQHLLQMSSGLSEIPLLYFSEKNYLSLIASGPPRFTPPGRYFQYTNSNYFVLGEIIKAVTGQPYNTALTNYITSPLGLTRTTTQWPPPAPNRFATGHSAPFGIRITDPSIEPRVQLIGYSNVSTTVDDLAKFDAALMNGTAVSTASFLTMIAPPGTTPEVFDPSTGRGSGQASIYGYALFHLPYTSPVNQVGLVHGGHTLGYFAANLMFPTSGLIVVVLSNQDWYNPQVIADDIAKRICTDPAVSANCR
jgi:D-alanyl-D-alanine carboxypeptidase